MNVQSAKAREGICLLLNNRVEEAEELFKDPTVDDSLEIVAGRCFVTFINALLSFESDSLEEAVQNLRDLEKRCAANIGWLKSVKERVFGPTIDFSEPEAAKKLEEQIILADTQVCLALLSLLQQDMQSYIKGSWVLRKAWKVYQYTYTRILELYRKTFPGDYNVPGSEFPTWRVVTRSSSGVDSDWSVPSASSQSASSFFRSSIAYLSSFVLPNQPESRIPPDVVARLMSAVSFGYGIFQLCVSLVPPSLLRIIHLLGFEGDRQMGLNALMFCRTGNDMRGPLALLALLWYHTIVRPFLALDGSNVEAGVDIANMLYEESKHEFAESAIFLFFHGRIQRLKVNIPDALKSYEMAIEKSPQREVQLLCLHEVGWCYLIQCDWLNAYHCFNKLQSSSKWSKALYTYLAIVSVGAHGNVENAFALTKKLRKIVNTSTIGTENGTPQTQTPLDIFITRRFICFNSPLKRNTCLLLAFELLYLWNALPSSSLQSIVQELDLCNNEEPIPGLIDLIRGVIANCQSNHDLAEQHFRQCLVKKVANNNLDQSFDHVFAFASYELALILINNKPEKKEEGRLLLENVRDCYKSYDFENRLVIRIHATLRILT